MVRRYFIVTCALTLIASSGRLSRSDAAQAVLLRNGNVLTGDVSATDDGYEVATEGAVLHVRRSQVAAVAASLVEAYERKRSEIRSPTAATHLQLAQWCIRYQLWPQAAREIVDARGLDPRHPSLPLIERQLALGAERAEGRRVEGSKSQEQTPTLRHSDPSTRDPQPSAIITPDIPDVALEVFARRVQPVLVNNCTAGGCHGEGGPSEFQLSRALLYDESTRDSTMGNLAATLAQVDRQQPGRSPLLRMSLEPHGGLREPPFPPHRRELHTLLVQWVELVSARQKTASPVAPPPIALPAPSENFFPTVQRGATGVRRHRLLPPYRAPNVKFGARLRKVEDGEVEEPLDAEP